MAHYFQQKVDLQFQKEPEYKKKYNNRTFQKGRFDFNQQTQCDEPYDPFPGPVPIPEERLKKYRRAPEIDASGIKVGRFRNAIVQSSSKLQQSIQLTARAEILRPEEPGFLEADEHEDTFRISQQEIVNNVDITSAAKHFSLTLKDFGPYRMNYSRDGRHLLLGGRKGHVAAFDFVTKRLMCEMNVMESVHDVCWLHIPTMFATAQKDHVFIYDSDGIELHCLKILNRVTRMEFLPYHFLLVTASEKGFLSWLDISIGQKVAQTFTKAGRLDVLCQNPYNALVVTGHPNGSISMWSPNVAEPVVKMLCHPHAIRAVAVDHQGRYLATAGIDRCFKIFDVRNYKCLQSYRIGSAAGFLNFSQQGLLCVGHGNAVEIFKDCCTQCVSSPYMRHKVDSTVADIQFCPYEDVLGIGHGRGFSSILVPGAGEPNFDTFESNPFMTKSQRREMEVKALLEKIPSELITEDPNFLGLVNVKSMKEEMKERKDQLNVKPHKIEFKPQHKSKGRSRSVNVFKAKKSVQEAVNRKFTKEVMLNKKTSENLGEMLDQAKPMAYDALDRFRSKLSK